MVKERLFASREAFATAAGLDGFYRDGRTLHARLGGAEMRLEVGSDGAATVVGDAFRLEVDWDSLAVVDGRVEAPAEGFDVALLWRMKVAWEKIFGAAAPNMVHPGGSS